ncbi:hypothetical protein D9758_004437 [Tetrapyrgos nigripes]|uniref:Uncharacterized protein n=1 Tax=Tetrapyrgos nigripes TaxID=182062 RepID=A0A8H5LS09_9AGAR|nr:hypothetical protein D9758_004437 [Tetrapyrgos nigripes]
MDLVEEKRKQKLSFHSNEARKRRYNQDFDERIKDFRVEALQGPDDRILGGQAIPPTSQTPATMDLGAGGSEARAQVNINNDEEDVEMGPMDALDDAFSDAEDSETQTVFGSSSPAPASTRTSSPGDSATPPRKRQRLDAPDSDFTVIDDAWTLVQGSTTVKTEHTSNASLQNDVTDEEDAAWIPDEQELHPRHELDGPVRFQTPIIIPPHSTDLHSRSKTRQFPHLKPASYDFIVYNTRPVQDLDCRPANSLNRIPNANELPSSSSSSAAAAAPNADSSPPFSFSRPPPTQASPPQKTQSEFPDPSPSSNGNGTGNPNFPESRRPVRERKAARPRQDLPLPLTASSHPPDAPKLRRAYTYRKTPAQRPRIDPLRLMPTRTHSKSAMADSTITSKLFIKIPKRTPAKTTASEAEDVLVLSKDSECYNQLQLASASPAGTPGLSTSAGTSNGIASSSTIDPMPLNPGHHRVFSWPGPSQVALRTSTNEHDHDVRSECGSSGSFPSTCTCVDDSDCSLTTTVTTAAEASAACSRLQSLSQSGSQSPSLAVSQTIPLATPTPQYPLAVVSVPCMVEAEAEADVRGANPHVQEVLTPRVVELGSFAVREVELEVTEVNNGDDGQHAQAQVLGVLSSGIEGHCQADTPSASCCSDTAPAAVPFVVRQATANAVDVDQEDGVMLGNESDMDKADETPGTCRYEDDERKSRNAYDNSGGDQSISCEFDSPSHSPPPLPSNNISSSTHDRDSAYYPAPREVCSLTDDAVGLEVRGMGHLAGLRPLDETDAPAASAGPVSAPEPPRLTASTRSSLLHLIALQ